MHSPEVSIIVPIYKTERYLPECIDSILTQTYTDFELILVDDGSPDKCGAICDKAAKQDARIRVLHQENQGVTRARANGVSAARGRFITFVDSDDTLPPHALATLIEHAIDGTDIVLGKLPGRLCPAEGDVCLKEYRKICAMMHGIHRGPVAKLYRRSLFDETVFDLPRELRIGEDAVMNIRLAYKAQGRIYSTAKEVYEYRYNENSAFNTYVPEPEMEALLQTHRLASIPAEDMPYYISCGLYKDIIYQWIAASLNTILIPPSVIPFHCYLLKIKKQTNLCLGLYAGILFYCTNYPIRFLVISLRNLFHSLKKGHCVKKVAE